MTKRQSKVPVPVTTDSRICFGIAYFTTEKDALAYSRMVTKRGDTFNGGWLHGKPCGRASEFDYTDTKHGRLFAVTTS